MEYALLRSLRTLCPGLLIISFFDLFQLLVRFKCDFLLSLDTSKILLMGYAVGGIYGVFADFLDRSKHAFSGADEDLLNFLREQNAVRQDQSWKDISPCYYMCIDHDKSLTHKSQGIMFNGLLVSSAFDGVVISMFCLVVGVISIRATPSTYFPVVSFLSVIFFLVVWQLSLFRHKKLMRVQAEVLLKRFKSKFANCCR